MKSTTYIKIAAFCLLIFIWDIVLIHFRELPVQIPVQFNLNGTPDGFGPKNVIWIFAGISTTVHLFMLYISNIREDLIEKSARPLPALQRSVSFLNYTNLLVMLVFAGITYEVISVALERKPVLQPYTIYAFMILSSLSIGAFLLWQLIYKKR